HGGGGGREGWGRRLGAYRAHSRDTKFADGSAALWFSTRLSAANANWPSLWLERIVSRHRRIDGSGCDRRWAPAQQHPIDVWRSRRLWRTRAERAREFQQQDRR